MDNFRSILKNQLTEVEIIIYLLVESPMTFREIAEKLKVSHTWVSNTYHEAKRKIGKDGI